MPTNSRVRILPSTCTYRSAALRVAASNLRKSTRDWIFVRSFGSFRAKRVAGDRKATTTRRRCRIDRERLGEVGGRRGRIPALERQLAQVDVGGRIARVCFESSGKRPERAVALAVGVTTMGCGDTTTTPDQSGTVTDMATGPKGG